MGLYIGVMSGTSMDAVDTAVVEFGGSTPVLTATASTAWPPTLRARLQMLAAGASIDATGFAQLDTEVGEYLAEAVSAMLEAHKIAPQGVLAIGCHGQTVAHTPESSVRTTLQLGDANVIAEHTGITTINDFRRRDMAAGGQGAPLAPAFHAAYLRDDGEDRVVLNLGGIANITILPADPTRTAYGFDTGPANCLMDAWTQQRLGKAYDDGGAWAATAEPVPALLSHLLDEPYFKRKPPKSTGTQHFSADWLAHKLTAFGDLHPAQIQATLMTLTARTVGDAVREHAPLAKRMLICGGGTRNIALIRELTTLLGVPVESTGDFGVDPEWMEAMAFAWLAERTLTGKPGNLPAVTGALRPRILGAIHPA